MGQRVLTSGEGESLIRRVGRTRIKRLEWAINFAQVEFEKLTPGDYDNLRLELSAFINLGDHGDIAPSFVPPEGEALTVVSSKIVHTVNRSFRRILDSFENKQCAELGPFKIGYSLTLAGWVAGEVKRRGKRQIDAAVEEFFDRRQQQRLLYGDRDQVALLTFGQLLDQFISGVRRCLDETCGRWFVAWRSNQEYCTRTCKSRAATRAKRVRDRIGGARPNAQGDKKSGSKVTEREVRRVLESEIRRLFQKPGRTVRQR